MATKRWCPDAYTQL